MNRLLLYKVIFFSIFCLFSFNTVFGQSDKLNLKCRIMIKDTIIDHFDHSIVDTNYLYLVNVLSNEIEDDFIVIESKYSLPLQKGNIYQLKLERYYLIKRKDNSKFLENARLYLSKDYQLVRGSKKRFIILDYKKVNNE